jgi:hypothetical protein
MLRRAFALAVLCLLALPAAAQVQRNFPQNALRGSIVFGVAPEITLNGTAARLAPGTRIRKPDNMLAVPSTMLGGPFLVNYTFDLYGLVKDIWVLTPAEAANLPWPATSDDAKAWTFDPVSQVWVKP